MNIKLHYLHQPDENTNNHGMVVFQNSDNLTIDAALKSLQDLLIGGEFFIPNRIGLSALYLNSDPHSDDDYHSCEGLESTNEAATDMREFSTFIQDLKQFKKENPTEFW